MQSSDSETHDNVVSVDFSRSRKVTALPPPEADLPPSVVQKRRVFEEFLEAGIVTVAFDPRSTAAEVPPRFRHLTDLRLNFSYGYRIDDFRYDASGIRATLKFPEGYFACFVPWPSLFAMRSETLQKDSFWLADAPKEVQEEIRILDRPKVKQEKPRPKLTLVKDDDYHETEDSPA